MFHLIAGSKSATRQADSAIKHIQNPSFGLDFRRQRYHENYGAYSTLMLCGLMAFAIWWVALLLLWN
jgi:hypothetical protein